MLDLGADVGLGGLDQIDQTAIRGIWECTALAGPHRHPKLHSGASHFRSITDALVAGIALNHLLIAMQQLASRGDVVHVGGRGHN